MCCHFKVSTSGYYKWKKLSLVKLEKCKEKMEITNEIKEIFKASKSTYGSPRIHKTLLVKGLSVSENTVAKYMRELHLDARLKKKFKVQTTNSNHDGPIADRVFKVEDALPEVPGEVLAGDITYLRVGSKFYYLSIVMDLYNREVTGWSISDSLATSSVLTAFKTAIKNCENLDSKTVFHSDRGVQYASQAFRDLLGEHDVEPSMSRKANCYDNAYVETWFKSFKSEYFYRNKVNTEAELRALVFEYIEVWYNNKRMHSSLDFMSPKEYKIKQQLAA